jgi:putative two-component system response regulator
MTAETMSRERKGTLLVVDDTPANVRLLAEMLRDRGYRVRVAPDGELALRAVRASPPDLILLDVNMPGLDGYEVCRRLKADERWRSIPVLFISAMDETGAKVRSFEAGGVDYITKPFQFAEVEARVETHLKLRRYQQELEEMVREQVREIADSQMATIFALARLAESRDDETGRHLERVREVCRLLALRLREHSPYASQIDEVYIRNLHQSSVLHDIGKVGISDVVLLKPGRLTAEEYEIVKAHPLIGARTLEAVHLQYPRNAFLEMGIAIARSHHEKWDGTGYPEGLEGERIPLCARIMGLADVYDAMRSKRVYKEAASHEETRETILRDGGTHFDPVIVEAFLAVEAELRAYYQG